VIVVVPASTASAATAGSLKEGSCSSAKDRRLQTACSAIVDGIIVSNIVHMWASEVCPGVHISTAEQESWKE
jgi:hypothetical protein